MQKLRAQLVHSLLSVALLGLVNRVPAEDAAGRSELASGWTLLSSDKTTASGAEISQPQFLTATWYPVRRMPSTVLAVLQDDGVYPDLYTGMNLYTEVP